MNYSHELKNIKTYKVYSVFNNLLILGPIITLFFIAKGLSFTEIFLLNSAAAITTILFEVPTGAVSDFISRKVSLFIGSIFCFISLFIYIFGANFLAMVIGEIFFSIGLTFRSGTEQAMLYDSLKNNNKENEYTRIEGISRSYTFYAQAFGSLIAGFVYEINIYLPFYISAVFMVVAALISLFYVEPHINKEETKNDSYFNQIAESFKFIFKHKKIMNLILFSAIFWFFYRVGFFYFQPYMEAVNIPVRYFGIIFFIFNIIAAYASKNAQKFVDRTKPRSLMALGFLLVLSFVLLSITKLWIGVVFIFMQQLARGFRVPVLQKYINKHIPSSKRATIISIQSLVQSIAIAILGPIAGMLLDNTNIFLSHLILGIVMMGLLFVVNILMLRTDKVNKIDTNAKVG